jgi:hypothetical protein
MTRDEVLAVLRKGAEDLRAPTANGYCYREKDAAADLLDLAVRKLAALYEDRDAARRQGLTFIRALAAILRASGGSFEVSTRDVLEVSIPPQGIRYSIDVEDMGPILRLRLVEHELPPIPEADK